MCVRDLPPLVHVLFTYVWIELEFASTALHSHNIPSQSDPIQSLASVHPFLDDSTRYDANSPGDLPVLTRFFPAEAVRHLTPKAKFL